MPRYESDVCIIGSGISATLTNGAGVVRALARPLDHRGRSRAAILRSGRPPALASACARLRREPVYPGDIIEDQQASGIISRTQAVGGLGIHFGGVMQRFSQEDVRLKSLYGLGYDWPIEWDELERYYCAAEKRIGVAGEPGPYPEDRRSEPYPMPAMELTWNLQQLKSWAEKSGARFWSTPVCKNTIPYDGRNVCARCDTSDVPNRRPLLARRAAAAIARRQEGDAARRHAHPAAGVARHHQPRRCRSRSARAIVRTTLRNTAHASSWLPRVTRGARLCSCCRRTRAFRTARVHA